MRHCRWFGRTPDTWPVRYSNLRLSRLDNGEGITCTYCYPHGVETPNSQWRKDLRCWKRYRRHQWHGYTTHRRSAQHQRRAH
jgi:hypothetical protein